MCLILNLCENSSQVVKPPIPECSQKSKRMNSANTVIQKAHYEWFFLKIRLKTKTDMVFHAIMEKFHFEDYVII